MAGLGDSQQWWNQSKSSHTRQAHKSFISLRVSPQQGPSCCNMSSYRQVKTRLYIFTFLFWKGSVVQETLLGRLISLHSLVSFGGPSLLCDSPSHWWVSQNPDFNNPMNLTVPLRYILQNPRSCACDAHLIRWSRRSQLILTPNPDLQS